MGIPTPTETFRRWAAYRVFGRFVLLMEYRPTATRGIQWERMQVVFTDLDGTLLDRSNYRCDDAVPAIELLRRRDVPLVFVTSKTRAEVEFWRTRLGNPDPFIVENGGAVFVPHGYFPFPVPGARSLDGYEVIEFGDSYPHLVQTLRQASLTTDVPIRGFHQMTAEEVGRECNLSLEQATLALLRGYDEPFLILDKSGAPRLLSAIEAFGRRWHDGGRFHHITGDNDKAGAVDLLTGLYERAFGNAETIGLGDAASDLPFLRRVGRAFVIASEHAAALKRALPQAIVSARPGPAGWRDSIFGALGYDTSVRISA